MDVAEEGSEIHNGTAQKRKLPMNEGRSGRSTKHRSTRACRTCRTRKVRCDILVDGHRCTNCRLDNIECFLSTSKRGKYNRGNTTSTNVSNHDPRFPSPARITEPNPLLAHSNERTGNQSNDRTGNQSNERTGHEFDEGTGHESNERTRHDPTQPPLRSASIRDVPVCLTFDEDDGQISDNQQQLSNNTSKDYTDHISAGALQQLGFETPTTRPHTTNCSSLPAFVSPLPISIAEDDVAFLAQKGAFMVPDEDLRAEILHSYIFSVHPFMPILDLQEFVTPILQKKEDGQISLLLFQAVMFAGLCSLKPHSIRRLGFETTKQARKAFFGRARLLYDFDVEPDSTAVLQSLLLMSTWYNKWNDRKHTWHWTGLALSVAQSMGLHREPTRLNASEKTRRLRKRLWWSLYIRDRIIALGTRRPLRIRDNDYDISMLTLQDFDIEPLNESVNGKPIYPDAKQNTYLAYMCIELAKLCICVGHVLTSQYTTLSTQSNSQHTIMVVPRRDCEQARELERCDVEINEWFRVLHLTVRIPGSTLAECISSDCPDVHWAILNMIHHTLVSVLHRPQILQLSSDSAGPSDLQRTSRSKVKQAARSITKIAHTMLRHDNVRFLSLSGITALVSASLAHMLDIRSDDEDIRDASAFRFYQSTQVLQSLRDIYASADSAVSFLASVIRRAQIIVPAQVTAPAPDFMSASADGLLQLASATNEQPQSNDTASMREKRPISRRGQSAAVTADLQINFTQEVQQMATQYTETRPGAGQDREFVHAASDLYPSAKAATTDSVAVESGALHNENPVDHGKMDTSDFDSAGEHHLNHVTDIVPGEFPDFVANDLFSDFNGGLDFSMGDDFITFDYDFYPDTFGPLDSQPPELARARATQ